MPVTTRARNKQPQTENPTPDNEPSEYLAHDIDNRTLPWYQAISRKPLGYILFLSVFSWGMLAYVFALLFGWTKYFDTEKKFLRTVIRKLVTRVPTCISPLWGSRMLGKEIGALPAKCVIVCNHQSFADGITIERLLSGYDTTYLVMEAMRGYPILGTTFDAAGMIFVGFKEKDTATQEMIAQGDGYKCTTRKQSLDEVKNSILAGTPVLIFPEGKLSRRGTLEPFKDGAFEVAIETGATIVPMALCGGQLCWPPDGMPSWGTQYLKVGDHISTDGLKLEDLPSLKARSKEVITTLRSQMFDELDWKHRDSTARHK